MKTRCPFCEVDLGLEPSIVARAAEALTGSSEVPITGFPSLCHKCMGLLILNTDLTVRIPTAAESAALESTPGLAIVRAQLRQIRAHVRAQNN